MAITVEQKPDQNIGTGDRAGATQEYLIRGTANPVAAKNALLAEAPSTLDSGTDVLVLAGGNVTAVKVLSSIPAADCVWEGTVAYRRRQRQPATGDKVVNFSTAGRTEHITQSLATPHRYAEVGETATDYLGAIGVSKDGVQGCDIQMAVYEYSETHYLDSNLVTSDYRRLLKDLTGKVNNAAWRGAAKGECLFLGASGSWRGENADWEISFRFALVENRTNITIGDITGIEKEGWQYLWVQFEDDEDAVTGYWRQKPTSVHIEQVYEYEDFSLLGIGS